jgi:hypothetical protein
MGRCDAEMRLESARPCERVDLSGVPAPDKLGRPNKKSSFMKDKGAPVPEVDLD